MEVELKGNSGLSVAFSQDGSRVASGSLDGTVRIWNAMTGVMEAEINGHTGAVKSVAFSQDGNRVVSGSQFDMICIWNVKTGEMEAKLKGHSHHVVRSVAFSQDDSRILSGSEDNKVRIWDVATGKMDAELGGHPHSLSSVALSLDTSGVIPRSFEDVIISIRNALSSTPQAPHFLVSLSCDGDWILGTHRDCWIPNDCRIFDLVSISGSRACFGCVDGRVIILDMTVVP
jgi:WD40 repeat protein